MSFAAPPVFNGYSAYSWQALHAISVGLGVPYELLAGDLKGVNFSSGRMGWLHFARRVDVWQWRMLIPQLCEPVWKWFMEAQALLPGGVLEDALSEWVPPRRDMVDPSAEVSVIKDRLRLGLITPDDALREMGYTDPDDVLTRYAAHLSKVDELRLVFDYDARKVSNGGQAQAKPQGAIPSKHLKRLQKMTAMTQTHETPMLSLRAAVRPGSVDIENRTAELTWTTGAKGRRWSWDIGAYMEELEVTPEAVRLDRLNNGAPFLNTHSAWELGDVVGVVERAWLEGGGARAGPFQQARGCRGDLPGRARRHPAQYQRGLFRPSLRVDRGP